MKRLYFQPIPSLTAVFAVMLALLIGLGVWQIQRLHWKLALIRTVHDHMTGPALTLHQALAMGIAKAQYHRVALVGHFDNRKEVYVYTVTSERPVYHVLTPFIVTGEGGRAIMVDRGYIPLNLKAPETRPGGELKGTVRVVGIWRHSYQPGLFTPAPNLKAREWFVRDAAGIARADGVKLIAPVLLEADAAPN
ncbi:MAG: SURF1 family protein, partial [Alphaproteobacteria bacterium]|nr:SURF1 family protein [Alphaproteobacteria bacterium]